MGRERLLKQTRARRARTGDANTDGGAGHLLPFTSSCGNTQELVAGDEMTAAGLNLSILQDTFAICRLHSDAPPPDWALKGRFFSITRTPDELSIVCSQDNVPGGTTCEKNWRCFRVEGPLDFSLTGILASLATPLAQAGISIFAVSTFETDYLLVKQETLETAVRVLRGAGHQVQS